MRAAAEWDEAPVGFFEEIIEARNYAHAWALVDGAKQSSDIPITPLTTLVKTITLELAREQMDESADE